MIRITQFALAESDLGMILGDEAGRDLQMEGNEGFVVKCFRGKYQPLNVLSKEVFPNPALPLQALQALQ